MKAALPISADSVEITLPANIDFKKLVQDSINQIMLNSAQNSGKTQSDTYTLSTGKLKVLTTITASEIALLASALKVAAADGLTKAELDGIIGDVHDLVKHGSTTKDFAKLISNPANTKYKLTPEVQKVLLALSPEDKQVLANDLYSQHVSTGQKILNFLTHTTEKLLPTLAIITDHIIKVGMPLLEGVIVKAAPGAAGVLIKTIVDGAGSMATGFIEKKMADTYLTDEQSKIASVVGQGLEVLTPLVGNVIAEKGGTAGQEIAKVLNIASSDIVADIKTVTDQQVEVAGDQALAHVDHV